MKKLSLSVFLLTVFVGISGCSNKEESTQVKKQLIEQAPTDFQPAFTKQTVIKLNAIVAEQLMVIDEYDAMKGPKASDDNTVKLVELERRSKSNLANMLMAEKQLLESGEVYNKATFAGMMEFVKNVQQELSSQVMLLRKQRAMSNVREFNS